MSAKSSGTTSMATTSAPASSARRASSGPPLSSFSRRETDVDTVRTTVRTIADDSGPLQGVVAGPASAAPTFLAHQLHRRDLHAALEALDHVVDGQRRDGRRGHGLHLHAGARGHAGGGG